MPAQAQETEDKKRMATEFKLPELGKNIESGDLVRLRIKPGGNIAEGEPVMELETDKAVVEVPSSVTGTIGEIRVKEGDKLRVGQVIFTVENGSGAATTAASKKENPAPPARPNPKSPSPGTPCSRRSRFRAASFESAGAGSRRTSSRQAS